MNDLLNPGPGQMTALAFDDIKNICTEFVNDVDTTIGMECFWPDYLRREVNLNFTAGDIMKALDVDTTDYAVPISVHHQQYGDMDVYVGIWYTGGGITISTKEWLLDENKYIEVLEKSN